jgi:hypothetical protein
MLMKGQQRLTDTEMMHQMPTRAGIFAVDGIDRLKDFDGTGCHI